MQCQLVPNQALQATPKSGAPELLRSAVREIDKETGVRSGRSGSDLVFKHSVFTSL
jgi:hypothetical protein